SRLAPRDGAGDRRTGAHPRGRRRRRLTRAAKATIPSDTARRSPSPPPATKQPHPLSTRVSSSSSLAEPLGPLLAPAPLLLVAPPLPPTLPLPVVSLAQLGLQPSPAWVLPSSHASP